ncbi:disease resistance protein RPV1-like isoform X7 [Diospyros lotus]|uniref:disease resistance protein RPV1-like isoform X7 n=1 Tax=Diospyros lotus TaxID=55363 RepID=UPI002259FAD5|nr:disease resistance protein RPV1-like isoform X7 [Diospyros lotus]
MAATTDQAASSSMSQCAYHVFLSFRGKDIRKTFIDHLHTALEQAGIHSFRDDDEIEKGEDIESELRRAIQQSRVSVIVFSKNYASSGWCLDELVNILQQRKTTGQVVLPVFYDADPSHVMNQTGTFGEAFARHEEEANMENDERKKEWMDRMKRWKEALTEVVNLGRKILQSNAFEHESLFTQEIVQEIGKKLNRTVFMVAQYPVGLDWRVEKINLWLQDGSSDAVIGVIHGMGGMGKTTIAKTIYNLNFERFKYRSFLADIREASKRPNGLVRLQTQLLEDILKGRKQKIQSIDDGIIKIKNAICGRKVFVVLDDVDQLDQLNAVFGMQDWLYPGSKIIITTRNERLIKARGTCKMFKVDQMDNKESFELFCWHAFGKARPDEGYMELSLNALQYCGGVPLALQVLGSSLHGRSVAVWESALKKLKAIPNNDVLETLAASFESLQDDLDKKLFLHIACFFVGKDKDYTVKVLDECELYPTVGIHSLVDRCLITIDDGRKLRMHQLIQDMAKEIIRKESPEEPGRRSFLCHEKDSCYVLSTKTGTDRIQGLILNMDMVMEENSPGTNFNVNNRKRHHVQDNPERSILPYQGNPPKRHQIDFFSWQPIATALTKLFPVPDEVNLSTDAFAMMHNLKLLKLNHVQVSGSYNEFPKEVRWLCWHGFALKYIPSDFPLESLVSLDMQKSSLKQLWKGTKLELIGNFDAQIIDKLGLVNLESMGTVEVELCNRLTSTRQKLPIQGLLEFGIFSTFLPGSRVPDSFSHKSTGSSTSFTVPWFFNLKILGLRLCVAYLHSDRHKGGRFYEFYMKITNNTKGLEWTYGPTFYGNEPEDILWLSHWSVRNQFQGGDEVNVSVVVGYGFQVRELGIDVMYDQEQSSSQSDGEKEVIQHRTCSVYGNVLDGDLSLYQLNEGAYVLCHHDLYHPFYSSEDFSDDESWGDPTVKDPSIWPPIFSTDEEEEGEEYEDSDEDF